MDLIPLEILDQLIFPRIHYFKIRQILIIYLIQGKVIKEYIYESYLDYREIDLTLKNSDLSKKLIKCYHIRINNDWSTRNDPNTILNLCLTKKFDRNLSDNIIFMRFFNLYPLYHKYKFPLDESIIAEMINRGEITELIFKQILTYFPDFIPYMFINGNFRNDNNNLIDRVIKSYAYDTKPEIPKSTFIALCSCLPKQERSNLILDFSRKRKHSIVKILKKI